MAYKSYTVKSGDSLSKIAAANGTTVSALLAENPKLTTDPKYNNGKIIFSGTIVRIPIDAPPVKSPATTTPSTAATTPYSAADFRRAEEASMASLPPVAAPAPVAPPAIVDERTQLAAKGFIPPYYEYYNGVLYNSGIPFTGLYQGVQYVNGTDSRYLAVPTLDTPTTTPTPEATSTQTLPTFNELQQLGPIVAANQTPALDASNLVGISTTAPAPVSVDPSFLLAYADSLIKANTLKGRSGPTRDLTISKAASMKELNVAQADRDLYNAKLKALASLADRGIYGSSGLGVAAQRAAGLEPQQRREEALNKFSEQSLLATRLFEQEQLEAKDIENQAEAALLKARDLASRLTKVGA
jgi:hypothetical protein